MDALPPNWTKYTTDDGKDYYHNAVTNTTQWERPAMPTRAADAVYNPSLDELDLGSTSAKNTSATVGAGLSFDEKLSLGSTAMTNLDGTTSNDMAPLRDGSGKTGSSSSSTGGGLFGTLLPNLFCFDITYLQTHFDVSSEDVTRRIKAALIPQKEATPESVMDFKTKPDFWGPFWICTTAVVFLAATGNFAQSFWSEHDVDTDWELVSLSACMLYGALVGVPLLTQILLYFAGEGVEVNLRQLICVYGYSFISLLPASVLMVLLPSSFLQWVIALVGCGLSCVFIRNHLWNDIAVDTPKIRYGLIALLFGAHGLIYFIYRTHFFSSHLVS
ncbi:unnamed protein product [Amoebophrya sp. A120]|nr:unnamed protein product [Amoebophrya sp. A120]|eukprot:GSA120T00006141001.1